MKAEIIILLLTGAIFLGCTTMVTRGLRNESEHKLITNETEAIAHNKLVFSEKQGLEDYRKEVDAMRKADELRRKLGLPDPVEVRIIK